MTAAPPVLKDADDAEQCAVYWHEMYLYRLCEQEAAQQHAYAEGRKDERETLAHPTEAMIEAGKDERIRCFGEPTLSVGAALSRIFRVMVQAAER